MLYLHYLNVKNEYSMGHFALKWLHVHYICVNFDTRKLAHTWKCHVLSISLFDIYLKNVCHAVQVTFVSISTKMIMVKFFLSDDVRCL